MGGDCLWDEPQTRTFTDIVTGLLAELFAEHEVPLDTDSVAYGHVNKEAFLWRPGIYRHYSLHEPGASICTEQSHHHRHSRAQSRPGTRGEADHCSSRPNAAATGTPGCEAADIHSLSWD